MPRSRSRRDGVWLSLMLHLALLLSIAELTRDANPWSSLAEAPGGSVGGGGGQGGLVREIGMINLPPPVAPETPRQVPARAPQVVPPRRIEPPQPLAEEPVQPPATPPADSGAEASASASAGSGTGTGGGSGSGSGPGTGAGAGPGTGTGGTAPLDSVGGRARPPEPTRVILPPFDYPRTMRGQSIDVNFFVLADGRVERVVFIPDVSDRAYARKLEDAMRAYRFRPARSASGQAIPGVAVVETRVMQAVTLGVPGLPQSATGTASLLTGVNVARARISAYALGGAFAALFSDLGRDIKKSLSAVV